MNYDSLIDILQQNTDEKYRAFNDTIVNGSVHSMGCRMPVLRKIAKNITLQEALFFPYTIGWKLILSWVWLLPPPSLIFAIKLRCCADLPIR